MVILSVLATGGVVISGCSSCKQVLIPESEQANRMAMTAIEATAATPTPEIFLPEKAVKAGKIELRGETDWQNYLAEVSAKKLENS